MSEETELDLNGTAKDESPSDYAELTQAVRDLVQVMHQGELERLEVSHGDLHILLCARASGNSVPSPAAPVASGEVPSSGPDDARADAGNFHHISSPMVGTFYEAPAPGEKPFVAPGDTVEVGQTVAIIEAMKIMNEIVADRPGVVDSVLVENGEAVEYGHPLIRLRPQ